jgi:hypothetical protein
MENKQLIKKLIYFGAFGASGAFGAAAARTNKKNDD